VTSLYRCVIRAVDNRNEKGRVDTARSGAIGYADRDDTNPDEGCAC